MLDACEEAGILPQGSVEEVTIRLCGPHGEEALYERTSTDLPASPSEIKPHPRGVELGRAGACGEVTRKRAKGQELRAKS